MKSRVQESQLEKETKVESVKELLVYVNGEHVPKSKASVSVFDHGFLYGDGIFEGIRVYQGGVFHLDVHLDRFYASAKHLMIDVPLNKKELKEEILRTLSLNEMYEKGYIRLVASRGRGDLGINPRKCAEKATLVIITDYIQIYPKETYETGISVVTCSTRKHHLSAMQPRVKSLNYLNNVLAVIEVNNFGAQEGIMLTLEGYVSEATVDNIFIVRDGCLITPAAYLGILAGITRQSVLEIAAELGIPSKEDVFTLFDLYTADEVFLTGTGAELIPVVKADNRIIGNGVPGPISKRILAEFQNYVKEHLTLIPR